MRFHGFLLLYISAVLLVENRVSSFMSRPKLRSFPIPTTLKMEVSLYGSQQTRSPLGKVLQGFFKDDNAICYLVNWYLYEKNIPFVQRPPRPSNHPFSQVPFLTDGEVEVFESGAILLYLADAYGGNNIPAQRASYTKWVVWANSELGK